MLHFSLYFRFFLLFKFTFSLSFRSKQASGSRRDFCGKQVKFGNWFLLAFADASGAGSASTEPTGQEQYTEEQEDEPEGTTGGTEEVQGGAETDPLETVPRDEVEVANEGDEEDEDNEEEEEEEDENIEEDEYLAKFINRIGPVSFTSSGSDLKQVT